MIWCQKLSVGYFVECQPNSPWWKCRHWLEYIQGILRGAWRKRGPSKRRGQVATILGGYCWFSSSQVSLGVVTTHNYQLSLTYLGKSPDFPIPTFFLVVGSICHACEPLLPPYCIILLIFQFITSPCDTHRLSSLVSHLVPIVCAISLAFMVMLLCTIYGTCLD